MSSWTTMRSKSLERTEVIEIGLKSDGAVGEDYFGEGKNGS